MSTLQPSQHPNLIFKGIYGNECEEFIAALEDLAYTEGWAEDRRRMLFFTRSRLRKAALRWFARLDVSVKSDWDLFVQALFDQYPPVVEPSSNPHEVGIATPIWSTTTFSPVPSTITLPANRRVPAAEEDAQEPQTKQARSGSVHVPTEANINLTQISRVDSFPSYDASLVGLRIGRLRIVYEDEMPPAYVWRGAAPEYSFTKQIDRITPYNGGSVKCVTLDRQDALLFCFRPDAEAYPIACLDTNQSRRDLAVLLESGSCEFHPLVATAGVRTASQVSLGSGLWRPPYQMVSKIWNVLEDGTLQATLSGTRSMTLQSLAEPSLPISDLDFPEPTQIDRYNELPHGKVEPSNWTTTTVYVDTAGVPISFAKDAVTTSSTHPNTNRPLLKARIVFEPFWSPAADSKTPPV